MSEGKAFLEKVHIENFRSLRDVNLSLKPLTVLVGPNASGKSNVLRSLYLLNRMIIAGSSLSVEGIRSSVWAREASSITFQLESKVEKTTTKYKLAHKVENDKSFVDEELSVNGLNVISTQRGQGIVRDEKGENETTYNSDKLALGSAGDYGDKPITRALTEFLRGWEIYDFEPDLIRNSLREFLPTKSEIQESPKLDSYGGKLPEVLWNWYQNKPEDFRNVSESLASSTNLKLDHCPIEGDNQLCLLEGYKNPIPLEGASDGTLRFVAYYVLLNETELPTLITIEEPERNLHPGALNDIADVLEQLAKRTQVIITTHSSQLLDTFSSESLSDWLGILLLRNRHGLGTEIINVEEIRSDRKGLDGWIIDFGVGSAIFDSGLLQDLMEDEPTCQA